MSAGACDTLCIAGSPGHTGAAASASDGDVVAELYREHAAMAFKLALRYGGGNRSWAEDIVHDVFLEVHRQPRRIAQMQSPGGWIYRATTTRCLNRLRRDRYLDHPAVRWVLRRAARLEPCPEAVGLARAELERMFAAVNELPPKQRIAFWMRYVDGMGVEEIGRVLGHSKGHVSKLLSAADRAIARLREMSHER